MKKLLTIVLALALLSSLAACGGKKTETTPPPADTGAPAETGGDTSGYTGGEYKLTASSHMAPEDLVSVYMDDFCDRVEERSGGKITFDRFYSSQIANQTESAEGLKVGTIDISLNDWATMASVNGYAKGGVVSLGYLFNSYDHVKAFAASDDYKQMQQELIDQTGVRNLAIGASGFRQVATKNAPISSIDDFQGLRIRVPDIAIYVNTFQALGCATTIVANSEVYTALQTGMVDSVENPVQGMYNMSWYEQLDYINETNHIFCDQDLFMNEERFQTLDAEAQAVILECALEASDANLELAETKNDEFLANCVDAGVEYVTFDVAPVKEVMKEKVWPTFFESVEGGEALVNNILALS
ncbi:TRAP transporter substrate-binding protein [uncultured Oscillibacter sp.]|uniref:TRAP transporter substrate-binding protein n=1 Tax=uncultured Oscillibacter sp. TaxID=876091 RepID=UPI0025E07661|nr:TRAP transporter substrate-binding protein [uncultured Oscillibacter sp.]